MGTSTIDGVVEAVWLKKRRSKLAVYDKIPFRLADGSERTVGKSIVGAKVADRLVPGTSGRFYLYKAIDHKGLHGIRDARGAAVCDFPRVNETAMLVVVLINAVWLVLAAVLAGMLPVLPLILIAVGVPLLLLYGHSRREAVRQFEADRSYAPPPAAATVRPALGA